MREQNERERMEKENALRQMKQKEEQLERERKEVADLRDKLSRAASLTPQVNKYGSIFSYSKFQKLLSFKLLHKIVNYILPI